jgi:FkbM family methyltransferase
MISSIKNLLSAPYNKSNRLFALLRFFEWKIIRLFKLTNYKKKVWGNKFIFLNYDSFQSMWIMYNWYVDWEEFNLIQQFIKQDDFCLDIGANMGFYSIWFSKFSNNILSFEPNSKNYQRLSDNINLNKKGENIKWQNIALGDQECEVNFTNDLDGQNHISLSTNTKVDTVICRRLDNVLNELEIENIKYAKIDVEGFELGVLNGMGNYFLNHKIDIIQIEINDAIINSGTTINDLLVFIKLNKYQLASYNVSLNKMQIEPYNKNRENYFLINNIDNINYQLIKG